MEEKKIEVAEEIKQNQTDNFEVPTVEANDIKTVKDESKFVRVLKSLGQYIKFIFYDFFTSFKYNKMKLPGFLIAIPGVFLGFFLKYHNPVVRQLSFEYYDENFEIVKIFSHDFSAIVLFILVLFGILNLFTAFSCMSKKSLGSVITATITSVVVVGTGIFYIVMLVIYKNLLDTGLVVPAEKLPNWNFIYWMSFISVMISVISSIAGCILGFIFYDRNYKKVKF